MQILLMMERTWHFPPYTSYECNVFGFYSDLKSMEKIPVVTALMGYDDHLSGNTVMLVFNKAIGMVWNQYGTILNSY